MVVWSKSACADLKKVEACFSQRGNAGLGKKVATHISLAAARLALFPLAGKQGRIGVTRELLVPKIPYMVIYVPETYEKIGVVRILPTDRVWPASLAPCVRRV